MNVNQQRWGRVEVLCDALEDLPPSEHGVYREAHGPDASVREEALVLFAASQSELAASRRFGADPSHTSDLPSSP